VLKDSSDPDSRAVTPDGKKYYRGWFEGKIQATRFGCPTQKSGDGVQSVPEVGAGKRYDPDRNG